MRQRLYLDNSVVGGYHDEEFKEATRKFFDRIVAGDFVIYFSEVNDTELVLAPQHIQDVKNLIPPDCYQYVDLNEDARQLASLISMKRF